MPSPAPEPVKSRRPWKAILLGTSLSVLLPVLAFQGVSLTRTWDLVTGCRPGPLALGGLFFLLTLGLRSWRWQQLMSALRPVRLRSCVSATCVGFMANNVLPLRLGDLVRVGVLRQLEGVSGARVLGNVVVEKLLDVLTLIFFLGAYLALAVAGPHRAELLWAGRTAFLGATVIAATLVAGYWRRQWLQRLLAAPAAAVSPALGDKVADVAGKVLEGLQVFRSPGQGLAVALLSGALWGASAVSYYFVGQSVGLGLAPADYVVVVFATAFGAILPAAPGSVGTFHGFARLGLWLVAVHSGEEALAFAALLHAVEWLLMNVTGLYFLVRDRVTLLGSIREDRERSEDAAPPLAAPSGSARPEYAQSL